MNISMLLSRDRHMMTSEALCMLSAAMSHLSMLCVLAWLCMMAQCLRALPFGGSIEEASAKRRRLYIIKRCFPAYGWSLNSSYIFSRDVLVKLQFIYKTLQSIINKTVKPCQSKFTLCIKYYKIVCTLLAGLPLFCVTVTSCLSPESYLSDLDICRLSLNDEKIYLSAYVAPVCFFSLILMILIILILKSHCTGHLPSAHCHHRDRIQSQSTGTALSNGTTSKREPFIYRWQVSQKALGIYQFI